MSEAVPGVEKARGQVQIGNGGRAGLRGHAVRVGHVDRPETGADDANMTMDSEGGWSGSNIDK